MTTTRKRIVNLLSVFPVHSNRIGVFNLWTKRDLRIVVKEGRLRPTLCVLECQECHLKNKTNKTTSILLNQASLTTKPDSYPVQ